MIDKPFFSIVIPTYNRATFILKTINSLRKQSNSSFEILIIDDGSVDNTNDIVASIKDDRIIYKKIVNGERGRARNFGTLLAKGDYITFIDSDDIAYPNHLAEAKRVVEELNKPEVFHLAYEIRDGKNNILVQYNQRRGNLSRKLLKGNSLSCIGVFLRQDIAKSYLFEEDRNLAGSEDWHLWLRLGSRFPIHYSNTITACMINHEKRSVLHFNNTQMLNRSKLLIQYLSSDPAFLKFYGNKAIRKIEAHMYTYISLHLILARKNFSGLKFLFKGVARQGSEIFQRRTLAILKHLLKNVFSGN